MKSFYPLFTLAFLFLLPVYGSSQQITTVVNSSNCNFTYSFNTTDEGFSSPSIYSDANDFGLYWNGSLLAENAGANFISRTASTISGIFVNTESARTTVGFDYNVPAGTEYRIRVISGIFNPPLEILATTANGPIWTAFPSTSGSLCLELQDADLPLFTQMRYEITLRTVNPGILTIDNFRRASQNIPLPVTFMGFIARDMPDGSIKLLWNVADEINVRGYEVETSIDGRNFTTTSFVNAEAKSNYSVIVPASSVTKYYRVRNIDFDNKYKYTGIIKVQRDVSSNEIKLYPVPASDMLFVEHKIISQKASIRIVTVEGRVIKEIYPQMGSYQTSINMSEMPAGIYFLKYDDGKGGIQTSRFVKH